MASTTLSIDTGLGKQQSTGDRRHLLLAAVRGVESFSAPHAYRATLYHSLDEKDIGPRDLVYTPVTIGMRGPSFEELNLFTDPPQVFLKNLE